MIEIESTSLIPGEIYTLHRVNKDPNKHENDYMLSCRYHHNIEREGESGIISYFDNIITYLLTLLTFVHMILPILSERLGFSKCRWCGRRECCGQGEGRCGCNCEHGVQDIWWSGTKVEVKWS